MTVGSTSPTYLLLFHGGETLETDEAGATPEGSWAAWFARLDIVDRGRRTAATARVVSSDGTVRDAPPTASGYTIVRAESLDAAADAATRCPILQEGGSVSVLETFDVLGGGSVS